MIVFHFQQCNNKVSFFSEIRNQIDKNRLDVCFSPYRLWNKRDSEIIKVRCSFPSKHSQGIVNSIDAQNIKQCGALFGWNRSNENVAKINICENNGASTEGTKRTSGHECHRRLNVLNSIKSAVQSIVRAIGSIGARCCFPSAPWIFLIRVS